jgi:hypothetical protein
MIGGGPFLRAVSSREDHEGIVDWINLIVVEVEVWLLLIEKVSGVCVVD